MSMTRARIRIPRNWDEKLTDIAEYGDEILKLEQVIATLRLNPTGHEWTRWTTPPNITTAKYNRQDRDVQRELWGILFDNQYKRSSYRGTTRNLRLANAFEKELKALKKMLATRWNSFYKLQESLYGVSINSMEYLDLLAAVTNDIDDMVANQERWEGMDAEGYHSSDNEELEWTD